MSDNAAFKELDAAFDSIIDEIENPDKPHEEVTVFRNLHGEKTEYADYATRQIPTGEIAITGILQYGKVNGKEYYMIKMRDEKDCSSIK